jgi:multicomponent Na+:H+ antiporter subunit G
MVRKVMTDMLAGVLIAAGTIFYLAGSIGLLRLPDTYCRLHALTKADNLGLGLLVAGLVLLADDLAVALKLVLIWLLVLAASAAGAHLIAGQARRGEEP